MYNGVWLFMVNFFALTIDLKLKMRFGYLLTLKFNLKALIFVILSLIYCWSKRSLFSQIYLKYTIIAIDRLYFLRFIFFVLFVEQVK